MSVIKDIENEMAAKLVALATWLRDPEGLRTELRRDDGLVTAEIVGFVVLGLVFLGLVFTIGNNSAVALGERIEGLIDGLGT